MKTWHLVATILLLSNLAFPLEIRCPENIETKQTLSKAQDGWDAVVDTLNGRQNLETMELYDGPFEEGAALVPDNESSKKDPYWTNHTLKGFWVACFYSQSTVRLTKQIPGSVKKCTLRYKPFPGLRKKILDILVCE